MTVSTLRARAGAERGGGPHPLEGLGCWALRPVWGRFGLREGVGLGLLALTGGDLCRVFQDNAQQRAGGPGPGCGVASLRTSL